MSRPLVYLTQTKDAATKLPVVVIDSTALAPDNQLPDPVTEVPMYLEEFPDSQFVVIFLASRASSTPNLAWIRKVHAMLDRQLKKRMIKVYVVHAKWYTRALNRAIGPVVSPKFSRKVVHIKDLAELSRYLDITAIDFNPLVYLDDLERSHSSGSGEIPVPRHCISVFGEPLTHTPTAYWRAALIYLENAFIDSSTFLPKSKSSDANVELAHVLINAVKREQRLRLADYGPYAVFVTLKEYMLCLPKPLIELRTVPLPLEDNEEFLTNVMSHVQAPAFLHLEQLISWVKVKLLKSEVKSSEVARSLGPAIFGLYNPSREQYAIATRMTRTLIEYWPLRSSETRKSMAPRDVTNELPRRIPAKPPLLPPRTHVITEPSDIRVDLGMMPRELPSEVNGPPPKYSIPNRRAFGRVAEIMKKYDESHYV